MKIEYKGYNIEVKREKTSYDGTLLFSGVYRISDGYECICCYEDCEDTIKNQIKYLKQRIDEEHMTDDPWDERRKKSAWD